MRKFLTLAATLAGVLALAGSALAYGPSDTKTQTSSGEVKVYFTPVSGKSYKVWRHGTTDGRQFVALSTADCAVGGSNPDWTCTSTDTNWGVDTTYGYVYYKDTSVQDYQEYYYVVQNTTDEGTISPNDSSNEYINGYIVSRAFPPTQTRHGEFTEYTNACTGCHGLHSAKHRKLLKAPTITDLCATCHDGTGSKYDEVRGQVQIDAGGTKISAPAGPFGDQLKTGSGIDVTSIHNVYRSGLSGYSDGYSTTDTAAGIWQAPGSGFIDENGDGLNDSNGQPLPAAVTINSYSWGSDLVCASCHEPHNKYKNYRLLRGDLTNRTGIKVSAVSVVNPSSQYTAGIYLTGKNDQTGYKGVVSFCTGCHRAFYSNSAGTPNPSDSTLDTGAGAGGGSVHGDFRHPVDVQPSILIGTTKIIDGSGSTQGRLKDYTAGSDYLPLEGFSSGASYNQNLVMCLSCHVPHGVQRDLDLGTPGSLTDAQKVNRQNRLVESAYLNDKLNGTDDNDATGATDRLTRDSISGYLHERDGSKILGSTSALGRFKPFASACFRCHSAK